MRFDRKLIITSLVAFGLFFVLGGLIPTGSATVAAPSSAVAAPLVAPPAERVIAPPGDVRGPRLLTA